MNSTVDVLMITHRRPAYVALALPRLIESLDSRSRLWLWHNGADEETLDIVRGYEQHPRIARVLISPENQGIRVPTNWLWSLSQADYVSKVDDDCLVDPDWIRTLRPMQDDSPDLGVLGSWRFYEEDFNPATAERKILSLASGHRLLHNHWVQGSGYLAKRVLTNEIGHIRADETFPDWCIRAALHGYVNGWAFPFVHEEHMDDPRSPWTLFTSDEVFMQNRPLSAIQTGVTTVDGWTRQMQRSARFLQSASTDLRAYSGWRRKVFNARIRISDLALRNINRLPVRRP